MRYADPAATNKVFGKNECVKSVLIFLGNYILLMALVVLFIWVNTLHIEGQSFTDYIVSGFNTLIYLAASLFMLFLTVYFYYIFEDKSILATPKSIWLLFLLLDTCLVICYFFGLFFNIYSRPIALLALLALLLFGRRDAIFLNIIFALTASFGDVGKAMAVVLMVLQVAGAGGTFPQQMLPSVFQAIYPWLPFVHAEGALRAAMFGLYGNDFWIELGLLSAYLVPALLLGLVLRRPVIRANERLEHALESTHIM